MKLGRIILVLIITGLLWGLLTRHIRQQFDNRRLEIIHQCEASVPVFSRRYQHLQALLDFCAQQDGWNMPEISRPASMFTMQEDSATFLTLPEDQAMGWNPHEALDHFINGGSPFEKMMGALSVEQYLQDATMWPDNVEAISKSSQLIQFKADLKTTDPAAASAINQLKTDIVIYDRSLSRNFIAKLLQIQSIERDSNVTPPIEDN